MARGAEGQHFGMRARIEKPTTALRSLAEHRIATHDQCSDRGLTVGGGPCSQRQATSHEGFVHDPSFVHSVERSHRHSVAETQTILCAR